ncbi:PapG chaperone-binding domain-containing protein [Cronobacter malonaticus]|uniref:PapG chaperone-binding domain-containing protein n=3 Tax=Cronobacter malonaticus TaxID=413503 RepID=UPI0038674412
MLKFLNFKGVVKIPFLVLLIFPVISIAGKWPVAVTIKSEYVGSGGAGGQKWRYYITQRLIEVGSSVDVVMPNNYVMLTHRHDPTGKDEVGLPSVYEATDSKKTISQIAVDLYNSQGKNVTYLEHTGLDPTGEECVGYLVNKTHGDYSPWSGAFVPGGCLIVPPADDWCKITTPEIVLEHGNILLKDAEGHSARSSFNVTCVSPTAVKFNLITNDNYVYLDEGKSLITIDEKPLNTKIDLPEGDSTWSIKDMLTGMTTEGYHTGSSVLVMMPY